MKVFIAAKYKQNNPENEELLNIMEQVTKDFYHDPFVGQREIDKAGLTTETEWMPFVRDHIGSSQLLILGYEKGLEGGLIEEGMGYFAGVPIWLLHHEDEQLSRSALGCANTIISYSSAPELEVKLQNQYRTI